MADPSRCIHGKTVEEDCDTCEDILEASGLFEVMDALEEEKISMVDLEDGRTNEEQPHVHQS